MTQFVPHREHYKRQRVTLHARVRQTRAQVPFAKRQRHCKKIPLPIFYNEGIKGIYFRAFGNNAIARSPLLDYSLLRNKHFLYISVSLSQTVYGVFYGGGVITYFSCNAVISAITRRFCSCETSLLENRVVIMMMTILSLILRLARYLPTLH